MAFPASDVSLTLGAEKETTTTQRHRLGTRGVGQDGERIYRYAQIGASAIGAGLLVQSPVAVGASSNMSGLAVISASSGATTLQVIPQHASTKNTYADGWLLSETSPNVGLYALPSAKSNTIDVHGTFTSGVAAELNLSPNDALKQAFTSGTHTVGLRRNLYKGVVVQPTTATGVPVGVTTVDVLANVFGWVQTWGPCMLNLDTAGVAGAELLFTGTSAGHAVAATTVADVVDNPVVAWAITGGAGADAYNQVYLRIAA